jgi:hypothetical protein
VSFKARLQRGNRVQVPKYVRWYFKLEPTQILEVSFHVLGIWHGQESFLCRITKDGRIVIPKLMLAIFAEGKPNLNNHVADIRLAPV